MGFSKGKKNIGLGKKDVYEENEIIKGLNKFLTSYLGLYI